ncbi:hypothetical protein Bbelb_233120 [Branchiostoma belcheri]|nr:hypothetical protein Bbelb_233120 [Branchiostoma belcheri]
MIWVIVVRVISRAAPVGMTTPVTRHIFPAPPPSLTRLFYRTSSALNIREKKGCLSLTLAHTSLKDFCDIFSDGHVSCLRSRRRCRLGIGITPATCPSAPGPPLSVRTHLNRYLQTDFTVSPSPVCPACQDHAPKVVQRSGGTRDRPGDRSPASASYMSACPFLCANLSGVDTEGSDMDDLGWRHGPTRRGLRQEIRQRAGALPGPEKPGPMEGLIVQNIPGRRQKRREKPAHKGAASPQNQSDLPASWGSCLSNRLEIRAGKDSWRASVPLEWAMSDGTCPACAIWAGNEGGRTQGLVPVVFYGMDRGWAARGRLARGDQGPDGRKEWILSRTGRKTAAGLAAECARELWEFVGRNFGSPAVCQLGGEVSADVITGKRRVNISGAACLPVGGGRRATGRRCRPAGVNLDPPGGRFTATTAWAPAGLERDPLWSHVAGSLRKEDKKGGRINNTGEDIPR